MKPMGASKASKMMWKACYFHLHYYLTSLVSLGKQ
uniref:Uncharacterized protein n=1 Tax=Rhizophora mucronata TaxID=61149 RepID=A0A2P2QEU2_RHIMU